MKRSGAVFRQKWFIYGLILVCLLGIWGLYVDRVFHTVDETSRQVISANAMITRAQIDRAFQVRAAGIQRQFGDLWNQDITQREQLLPLLQSVRDRDPDHAYYVALSDGKAFNANGNPVAISLNAEQIRTIAEHGCVLFEAANPSVYETRIVLATAISQSPPAYAFQVNTAPDIADVIVKNLSFTPDSLVLFAPSGAQVAMLVESAERESYGQAQALQFGAMDFAQSGSTPSVESTDARRYYRVYVPLDQPAGWFIGGRLRSDTALPLYNGVMQASVQALCLVGVVFVLIVVCDSLYERRKTRRLQKERFVDPLTGLANSAGLPEAFERCMQEKDADSHAFVCLDIASFHRFNTMFGHTIGDKLLLTIGRTIGRLYPCGARVGGDVFAFVAPMTPGLVGEVDAQLRAAVQDSMGTAYLQMISLKFGLYPLHADGVSDRNLREIQDGAMQALRSAKQLPDQEACTYDLVMQKEMETRETIELNMLHALSREEFKMYVQPQFAIHTETFCGGEALVRWHSEQLGFMLPDEFIPLFEENGFVVELDFYMLKSVLDALQSAYDGEGGIYPISVNQSKMTILFPNYLQRLKALIAHYTVPLRYVHLEVTESVVEHDAKAVQAIVGEMKAIGFSIALDDFGVGFSSLNTLRDLPVDVLKLDKGFLNHTENPERNQTIIRNIINMAKDLNIRVICEGVENRQQLEFLRQMGCDDVQGYYYAEPMPFGTYAKQYFGQRESIRAIPAHLRAVEGSA